MIIFCLLLRFLPRRLGGRSLILIPAEAGVFCYPAVVSRLASKCSSFVYCLSIAADAYHNSSVKRCCAGKQRCAARQAARGGGTRGSRGSDAQYGNSVRWKSFGRPEQASMCSTALRPLQARVISVTAADGIRPQPTEQSPTTDHDHAHCLGSSTRTTRPLGPRFYAGPCGCGLKHAAQSAAFGMLHGGCNPHRRTASPDRIAGPHDFSGQCILSQFCHIGSRAGQSKHCGPGRLGNQVTAWSELHV
jgi:hypothetical protein